MKITAAIFLSGFISLSLFAAIFEKLEIHDNSCVLNWHCEIHPVMEKDFQAHSKDSDTVVESKIQESLSDITPTLAHINDVTTSESAKNKEPTINSAPLSFIDGVKAVQTGGRVSPPKELVIGPEAVQRGGRVIPLYPNYNLYQPIPAYEIEALQRSDREVSASLGVQRASLDEYNRRQERLYADSRTVWENQFLAVYGSSSGFR